uniref:Uncharacterized protein n=1 Tax=Nelumbo nucifera TaxID=4432 RepID=A0A822XKL7_NELNU|nr:TPA_asm: hypothetical protein HUJ06_022015 [Nelumbo nucifera]
MVLLGFTEPIYIHPAFIQWDPNTGCCDWAFVRDLRYHGVIHHSFCSSDVESICCNCDEEIRWKLRGERASRLDPRGSTELETDSILKNVEEKNSGTTSSGWRGYVAIPPRDE